MGANQAACDGARTLSLRIPKCLRCGLNRWDAVVEPHERSANADHPAWRNAFAATCNGLEPG